MSKPCNTYFIRLWYEGGNEPVLSIHHTIITDNNNALCHAVEINIKVSIHVVRNNVGSNEICKAVIRWLIFRPGVSDWKPTRVSKRAASNMWRSLSKSHYHKNPEFSWHLVDWIVCFSNHIYFSRMQWCLPVDCCIVTPHASDSTVLLATVCPPLSVN